MAKTLGCIGCGNMGSALLAGFASVLDKNGWQLLGYNPHPDKVEALAESGVKSASSIDSIVRQSDIIVIAVKPNIIPEVTASFPAINAKNKIVISIAAGTGLARLRTLLNPDYALARCMPTTTAKAGKGVFAFCFDPINLEKSWHDEILDLFSQIGFCIELPENKFTDFCALIGACPAYLYQIIQGLIQAGITVGFTQKQSRNMLLGLFAGCIALAKQEKDTPIIQLRDDVCSPGGLTIAGINVLERAGISGLMVDTVLAARKRGKEMES